MFVSRSPAPRRIPRPLTGLSKQRRSALAGSDRKLWFLFFFLRQKEEVNPDDGEQHGDAGTDVVADCRFFLTGDSPPIHRIEMNVIESAISGVRQDGIRLSFLFASQVEAEAEFRGAMVLRHPSCPQQSRVIG